MNKRIRKVNSLLEHEISNILLRGFDFSNAIITLTRVETTANLIEAKVYISVLPEEKTDFIVNILNKQVYEVQKKINKKLNMRPVPKIAFLGDNQIVSFSRVERLLIQLKKKQK